jgi:hypothetical protein
VREEFGHQCLRTRGRLGINDEQTTWMIIERICALKTQLNKTTGRPKARERLRSHFGVVGTRVAIVAVVMAEPALVTEFFDNALDMPRERKFATMQQPVIERRRRHRDAE